MTRRNIPIDIYCDSQNNEYAQVLKHPTRTYVIRNFSVENNSKSHKGQGGHVEKVGGSRGSIKTGQSKQDNGGQRSVIT